MSDALELTKKQKAAFTKLKKAYKALENMGVGFYNCYGTLYPYQKKYVLDCNDDRSGDIPLNSSQMLFSDRLRIVNEWTDDAHYAHLTDAGRKVHNNPSNQINK